MLKEERHAFILHEVNLHNKVLSADLRHLQQLADDGKIIKVHGGALSPSFHSGHHTPKELYGYKQKSIIAQKAVSLIKDGMFILSSGGTTIIELARALPPALHATFISGSIPALFEYSSHPNIEVIAIGDKVSKNSKITVGPEAISKIKEIKADLCFLGVNAINVETGMSDNDWDVVQIKKAMIESTRKLVCLTISEKINSQQPIQVCDIKRIDTLITELTADDELLKPYMRAGITII
jgi:DeoR/GlpR family transcriptional regulator of sugar metabolism